MTRAKFSIGIDLGTTNCAMAFEALDGADTHTEVFAIPQWEKPGVFSEFATLPSFLYLPAEHEAAALGGQARWVPVSPPSRGSNAMAQFVVPRSMPMLNFARVMARSGGI